MRPEPQLGSEPESGFEPADEANPAGALDDLVHQRVRLGILTVANEARRVDFAFLLDTLALTPGNLSQHLRVLEDAGLVAIDKTLEGRRPRTRIALTRAGRLALHQEIAALKALVRRVERRDGALDR